MSGLWLSTVYIIGLSALWEEDMIIEVHKMGREKLLSYFTTEPDELLKQWDGQIKTTSVCSVLEWRELLEPIPCGHDWIPSGFLWDGASSGRWLSPLIPRWRHPVFSCKHDFRNFLIREMLRYGMDLKEAKRLRKISDQLGREDILLDQKREWVGKTEAFIAYYGMRFGALLRIGLRV